ncbi:hypothetical protein HK105_206177 [Polyrhizophydium stewartii]|uniref:Velvet domain-containing protein n=1 Tax=Polyrhizophydium stewartii TaxID=2732419 RepID=A0ABR4N413_9FUNG
MTRDDGKAVELASVTTTPFKSTSPRDWGGYRDSSELVRSLVEQGVRMPLRRKVRTRYTMVKFSAN